MKKVMLVTFCAIALMLGNVSQAWSSVLQNQQKKEAPTKSATKVIYTCSMHPVIVSDKPGNCPVCKMALVKKEVSTKELAKLTYTCSMHPIVQSSKPGKCPICKMDLVKKSSLKK